MHRLITFFQPRSGKVSSDRFPDQCMDCGSLSILLFFPDGKAGDSGCRQSFRPQARHVFAAHVSSNAENHQQPDAQVDHRILLRHPLFPKTGADTCLRR